MYSICVPNYNYGRYLRETLDSALIQSHRDLEVIVSDNASEDDSVEVAQGTGDPRVHVFRNDTNLGFAANLDLAVQRANGHYVILLSSDDLMLPGAVATYARLHEALGESSSRSVVASRMQIVDQAGTPIGETGRPQLAWDMAASPDTELSATIGAPVFRASARDVLRRSLRSMRNPLPFLATCYPLARFHEVGGYTQARLINPDKWFNWRLLANTDEVFFVDVPLFAYRWHDGNQTAQQSSSQSLKFWVDEYASTLQMPEDVLDSVGMSREDLARAFVRVDIAERGLLLVARGERQLARRVHAFGRATYPREATALPLMAVLALAARSGRPGTILARRAYARRVRAGAGSDWSPHSM